MTATVTTQADIRSRAASMLGRLRLGQSLDDVLDTRLQKAYNEVYLDLKDDQIVTWAQAADLPSAMVPHVVALMAFNCTTDIGVSDDRYQRIVNARNIAKREIRRLSTPQYEAVDKNEDY